MNFFQNPSKPATTEGRLLARPMQPSQTAPLGLQPLELDSDRDGFLYVPIGYRVDQPAPLVLMLHNAGSNAKDGLLPFQHLADTQGLILLAPTSRSGTWDILLNRYGPDIAFIDQALMQTFSRYAIDIRHVAIEGFSDGASYALSVGITNGDLFTHIIAFSPEFIAPTLSRGKPRLFLSHGRWDNILPVRQCSRKIVPLLERAGYDVLYREFYGFHTVPNAIAHEASDWFLSQEGAYLQPQMH
ncbi:MAG TPA: hypothetical protein V6C91_21755 [Coleofasciculaceae cyanobacterium]